MNYIEIYESVYGNREYPMLTMKQNLKVSESLYNIFLTIYVSVTKKVHRENKNVSEMSFFEVICDLKKINSNNIFNYDKVILEFDINYTFDYKCIEDLKVNVLYLKINPKFITCVKFLYGFLFTIVKDLSI